MCVCVCACVCGQAYELAEELNVAIEFLGQIYRKVDREEIIDVVFRNS